MEMNDWSSSATAEGKEVIENYFSFHKCCTVLLDMLNLNLKKLLSCIYLEHLEAWENPPPIPRGILGSDRFSVIITTIGWVAITLLPVLFISLETWLLFISLSASFISLWFCPGLCVIPLYWSHWLLRFKEEPSGMEDTDSPVSIFNERPDILASLFEIFSFSPVCVCLYEWVL